MKRRSSKNAKPRSYGNIASAIIPTASLLAAPAAAAYFPRQKINAREEWEEIAPVIFRASLTSEQLVPSTRTQSFNEDDEDSDDESYYRQKTKRGTPTGRMDASSDDDGSDGETTDGKRSRKVVVTSSTSRSASLTETEKRLFGHERPDEKSAATTTADPGLSSTIHLDAKPAAAPASARSAAATNTSTTSTTSDDKVQKKVTVTVTRQYVPPLVLNPTASPSGPAVSQASTRAETIDDDGKSVGNTTARSSVNDSTTAPTTARSVSFKEPPMVYQTYEPSSSKSQPTTTSTTVKSKTPALDRLVVDLPDEYQQKLQELQQQNEFLNDQVQRLQTLNRKQQEELHDRLQASHKLSQTEIVDVLKQSGQDKIKYMQEAYESTQERCRQLQMELASLKERHALDMEKSNVDQLKNQNKTLEEHNRRLNAALSEYQAMYPSETLKNTVKKEERRIEGLPTKGPIPIWMLDRKFLAPLFVFYDQKLQEKNDFIHTIQNQLADLEAQVKSISNENSSLYRRVQPASASPIASTTVHTLDLERVKQQAYLVLEENKVLHEHLDLQTNRLTDMQKSQNQEVSNLTRRLIIVEKEKTDADRTVDTIRMRNEELRTKYDQLIIDNDHRIHVDEHMREMAELKRIIDELSEKHASEMQLLLRRVQESETAKKLAQSKLSEYQNDMERLRGEIKATTKFNRKLQIRVQTFEKKLELQQIKEQHTSTIFDQTNEALEKTKLEQEAHVNIVKAKDDEMKKLKDQLQLEAKRFAELERRLESSKSQSKDRIQEIQEHTKKQIETLQLRCTDYDQRLQQLSSLLTEKQILVDDLNSEKRNLEVSLEHIWLTTNADNKRMHEQLRDMHVVR